MKTLKINERDNVEVVLDGELRGHKIALCDISKGEDIIKYGYSIGHALMDIKKGGITTLEDKSLGCVQKSGTAEVADVISIGELVKNRGLNLLTGPGNDIVAVTNLTASGCHMILFSTGRGTPVGAPVPTVKIATNTPLAERKPHWIDFNAGPAIDSTDLSDELMDYIVSVAEGEKTNNEKNGYREISIFKDGVML